MCELDEGMTDSEAPKKLMWQVSWDGYCLVSNTLDLLDLELDTRLEPGEKATVTIERVLMTQEEIDKLPEYDGS